jgi:hypothetical protein
MIPFSGNNSPIVPEDIVNPFSAGLIVLVIGTVMKKKA